MDSDSDGTVTEAEWMKFLKTEHAKRGERKVPIEGFGFQTHYYRQF